jgi:plasmid stability protein
MPRKMSSAGKPVDSEGSELKAVRVELTPALHKQLRIEAAKHDRSMASMVRTLIEDYLSKRKNDAR